MKISAITLYDAIKFVDSFSPVKIVFNDTALYNDYDDMPEESKVRIYPLDDPDMVRKIEKIIVSSINIEIVQLHHSIITIRGEEVSTESKFN